MIARTASLASWTRPLVAVDLFAGGGGASEGIRQAFNTEPILAVNHNAHAIQMHRVNHPLTVHCHDDVWDIDPAGEFGRRNPGAPPLDLLWASPDCKHFSKAKGGKPLDRKVRGLANVVLPWARDVQPRVICIENVEEFLDWGPLYPEDHPNPKLRNRPIPERKGEEFRAWTSELEAAGYDVQWRVLDAADYGAPTHRKRLFVAARCDGKPIEWPEPTHGPGRAHAYRTAAECIDWSIPAPSIFCSTDEAMAAGFGRVKRPLAENTQRRIARGIEKFVYEQPYILPTEHADMMMAGFLISTRNGERKGQEPRTRDLRRPLNTITARGSQGGLVVAWLAKHNGGNEATGQSLHEPMATVTARDSKALVAAFLVKYYGTATGQRVDSPMHTIVGRARFGLVTVMIDGETYAIVDIGMRMLQPRELARAQGFPDSYELIGTKEEQTARIGNSVSPMPARALLESLFRDDLDPRIDAPVGGAATTDSLTVWSYDDVLNEMLDDGWDFF